MLRPCGIMSERVKVDSCAKVNDHAEVNGLSKICGPSPKLDFFEYGVRGVRNTKNTVLQGYGNKHGVR